MGGEVDVSLHFQQREAGRCLEELGERVFAEGWCMERSGVQLEACHIGPCDEEKEI